MTPDPDSADHQGALAPERLEAIRAALEQAEPARLEALLEPLHPVDLADLIDLLRPAERRAFIALKPGGIGGEVLSELSEALREEVIGQLPAAALAEAVRALDSDDVVDLIEDLDPAGQARILGALEAPDRVAVEQSLAYPDGSAGRLMQREVVSAPMHWSVGEAIDFLRAEEWLPDPFYHLVLVDARMKPAGHVALGRILAAPRATPLADLGDGAMRIVRATDPEAEVAHLFNRYRLVSAPVVDGDGRLVGVITIDDALEVLEEEHEEDAMLIAGAGAEASVADGAGATVRRRLPWLVVNLATATLSAGVITFFEETIAALVVLAALMPIIASTGGIAGTQSLAVAVRGLATRSLTRANAGRVVRRELGAGVLNGLGLAAILGVVGAVVLGDPVLGLVLAGATVLTQMVAALAGVIVPLGLDRLGFDPALASGTFLTTLTDVAGFFVFLGLATLVLL